MGGLTEYKAIDDETLINSEIVSGTLILLPYTITTDGFTLTLEIPLFQRPVDVISHGSSAWARSYRIDIQNDEGEDESYFMKVRNFFPSGHPQQPHLFQCVLLYSA